MLRKKKKNPIVHTRYYPFEYFVKYGKYRRRVGGKKIYHVLYKSYLSKLFPVFKRREHGYNLRKYFFMYTHRNKFKKWKKRKKNNKYNKYNKQRSRNLLNTKLSTINIVVKRRNTFINLSTRGKIFKSLSAGVLGYTGRKKSAPIVRERIAKELASVAVKFSRNVVDLFLIKKKGRLYRSVIKGLACRGLYFRWVIIRHIHSHGHMRSRKKRRT